MVYLSRDDKTAEKEKLNWLKSEYEEMWENCLCLLVLASEELRFCSYLVFRDKNA